MMPEASSSPAAKSNLKARRRNSHSVDRATGLVCDQTVALTGFYSRQGFNRPLRRIKFNHPILSLTVFEKTPVNGLFDNDQGQKYLTAYLTN